MPSFFRAFTALLAIVALCATASAQTLNASIPVRSQPIDMLSAYYTGRVCYGDTGKPAAGIRVYFQIMHEGINDNIPIEAVTTDATGTFHFSRYLFPLRWNDFIEFEVDDPRNRYAAEVVQGCPSLDEALPGMGWTFPTLTENSSLFNEPYPNGILRFVPNSTWQDKGSTFITMETGTFVSGTITDATNGRPLSGIPLYTCGPHNDQPFGCLADSRPSNAYTVITDSAGHYRLPVAPGQCTLAINHQTLNGDNDDHKVTFNAVRGKTSTANLALSADEIARLKRESVEMQKRTARVATSVK